MTATPGWGIRPSPLPEPPVARLARRTDGATVGDVLADANRRLERAPAPGRRLKSAWRFDAADQGDRRWWPQGVTTPSDATLRGRLSSTEAVDGRRVALVAWYAKERGGRNQGSRFTVADLDRHRYRHVLLVRPRIVRGRLLLEPLRVHAGGLLWIGGWLHVAATANGFYSARIDDIRRIPDHRAALRREAQGYRYVLPVTVHHRPETPAGMAPLRYSFFSIDPGMGDTPARVVVGEYGSGDMSRRLAAIELDPGSGKPTLRDGVAAVQNLGDGVGHMQGATVVDGTWHVTTSHGPVVPGSLLTGRPGDLERDPLALPMGPEDVSYDHRRGELVSVSEHPWRRWIYTAE